MYLFFDTETTGLPLNYHAPIEDLDNWPRLVQLAWVLTDGEGKVLKGSNRIIRPEGFEIPEKAASVHGITTQKALEEGKDLVKILLEFSKDLAKTKTLVAHNISFDEKIMGSELLRKQIKSNLFDLPQICTMHSSTEYCAIPGNYGYKWPKLMELHERLFDVGFEDAHDALADVKACAKCFFELRERGIL